MFAKATPTNQLARLSSKELSVRTIRAVEENNITTVSPSETQKHKINP